ncbi:hypothetical protein THRCLA_03247 [Thraustotheca clavata]|uniref:EF-hand domain-containing protein n=1 Tax=Thraustotheca clavata TaxID=74557 RepID=A0A1W0A2N3_9STRA|nr:hypothetical protein THRCLA_03247 [Thraustotheca clavata]
MEGQDSRRWSSSRMAARNVSFTKDSEDRQPSVLVPGNFTQQLIPLPRKRRGAASAGATRFKSFSNTIIHHSSALGSHTKVHFFSKFHKKHHEYTNQDPPEVSRKPFIASHQGPTSINHFINEPKCHDLGTIEDHRGGEAIMNWLEEFPHEENDFLSPTNFYEMKYSQARRLTQDWPVPQRLRLAVAFTAMTTLSSQHISIPPTLLSQFLEDIGPAIFKNYDSFDQEAIDLNPFLYYYQQATTYYDEAIDKALECDRLQEEASKLVEKLDNYHTKQKHAVSSRVIDRFRTSMHHLKHNTVTPHEEEARTPVAEPRLPTESQIKDYFALLNPETLASTLHRILSEANMPSIVQTLVHLVDELDPDQRQVFYRAYQKCMTAEELFNFIAQEINKNNPYIRDVTLRLTKKNTLPMLSEFVKSLRKHLLLDSKPAPQLQPSSSSTFTAEESQILVTIESFMTRLNSLKENIGQLSLLEIIPRHGQVRLSVAKLLELLVILEGGDPNSVMESIEQDDGEQTQDDIPREGEDDDFDEEETQDGIDEKKCRKKMTRKKTKKRRSTILAKLKSRTMPLYDVCTTISSLICEKLIQDANDKSLQSQPLKVFTRQYFIRVYGLKSLALSHIASFRTALNMNYKENPRVNLFYWFIGMDDNKTLSAELGFDFFKSLIKNIIYTMTKVKSATVNQMESPSMTTIESLIYSWNDLIGDGYTGKDVALAATTTFKDKKRIIPVLKALEACKLSFVNVFEKDSAVLTYVDDLKNCGQTTLLMEDFIMQVMDVWSNVFDRLVVDLRLKFKEADENGDGTMDFNEFYAFLLETKAIDVAKLEMSETNKTTQRDASIVMAEARQIDALRRKAIAIYDSITNENNIIDEIRFVTYMITQIIKPKKDDEVEEEAYNTQE